MPALYHGKTSRRWPSWVNEQIRSLGQSPLWLQSGEARIAWTCPFSAERGHHRAFNQRMRAARGYEDVFRFSFARLPLCERPDIGNFAALVRPGIDRPELVGLAVLDHRRVVRTLGE